MRPEKESMMSELRETVDDSVFVILTDFGGMNMQQNNDLRTKLREHDAQLKVVKNRMLGVLADEIGIGELKEGLTGPTGMITGSGDVSAVVKTLKDFVKEHEIATLKVGALDGAFLSAADIERLANLPSKEELLGKIVGSINAPASNLVNTMNNAVAQVVRVIAAIEAQKREQEA